MTLFDGYNFLNFYINKFLGSYYTTSELDLIVDRASISNYEDYQPKYATSQRVKDALAPFRATYTFGFPDSINGIVTIPSNQNYLNFLDMYVTYTISGRSLSKSVPVVLYNEDMRTIKLNSQVSPVSSTAPIGEMIGFGKVQLYPAVQYQGAITFLRRPLKPFYATTTISGRLIYDSVNSIQLEWPENLQNEVFLKGLATLGINVTSQELMQFTETKTQENFMGKNHS